MQRYLREFANYNKSCTDVLEGLRDGFVGQAAMVYTEAVRDQNDEFSGAGSEWKFGCLP